MELQAVPPVTSYFRKEEQFNEAVILRTSYFRKEEQFPKRLTQVEKISFFCFPHLFYNNYIINSKFCQDFFFLKFMSSAVCRGRNLTVNSSPKLAG